MNKSKKIKALLMIVAGVALFFPGLVKAEDNVISLGVGGGGAFDSSGLVTFVEYERAMTDNLGLALRLAMLSYEYDDGYYWEDGDGPGVQATLRFYPSEALKGFYLGGGTGIWLTEWDWADYYGSGSGDSSSVEVHFDIGARFGSKVLINPLAQVGYFVSSSAELGPYLFLGVAVGVPF